MTTLSTKWAYTLSALVGAGSWIAVAQMTGRREAWDSEIYFSALLPGLWVCCAGLGFLRRYVLGVGALSHLRLKRS